MSSARQLEQNKSLREAEGYLDLLVSVSPRFSLPRDVRLPLAERAIAALDRQGDIGAWFPRCLYLRGQALRIMERYAEAVVPLRRAADLAPESQHVWVALGWCYKRCQRIDLAIEALEEALALAPNRAILHYNLACYWSLARNVKQAVTYLARAVELDPHYREAVATEPDFDPIRAHPHFQSISSVIV